MTYRLTPWIAAYVGWTQNRSTLAGSLMDRFDPRNDNDLEVDGEQFFVKLSYLWP